MTDCPIVARTDQTRVDARGKRREEAIAERAPNDGTSAVALVMIDTLLDIMLEVLEEYDRRVREEYEEYKAARAVH